MGEPWAANLRRVHPSGSSKFYLGQCCSQSMLTFMGFGFQGTLREKDFDITREAGRSFLALRKTYEAVVKDNFLEVHFFWAGKGTCCIPTQGYYGPAISAIGVSPSKSS